MPQEDLRRLRDKLGEISDVKSAVHLLEWDQETCMPPKAAPERAQQLASLSSLAHRMFTSEEMRRLIDGLSERAEELDAHDAKLVEIVRYDYNRANRLPEPFVHELALETSRAFSTWAKARAESDFALFRPHLERITALNQKKADLLGYSGSPYNALLEDYERGMSVEILEDMFGILAEQQSSLLARIMDSERPPNTSWLAGEWPQDQQWAFSLRIIENLGYDLQAGRQDKSLHPFSISLGLHDVRITTRTNPKELFQSLMGSIHECGHALYSLGHDPRDQRTPLLDAPSLGMHESQSCLWENFIAGSLPFWHWCTPILREYFPGRLDAVSPEEVYAAVNRVEPSLIRVDADECTYNLHVILRFEIERDLIEGNIEARDVPEIWNQKMKQYLGVDVPDDANGCLQDVHWSHGAMGYFPTYALGNLYAAQLLEQIADDIPELWEQVAQGCFEPLLMWLRDKIHRQGRRKLARELLQEVTGRDVTPEPFLTYLKNKYAPLYGV